MIIEIKNFEKLSQNQQYMLRNKLHQIAIEFMKNNIKVNEVEV